MSTHNHTHVASRTPQRTRIKVSSKRRNPEEMTRIANALKEHPEIHDVQTNVTTGSIIIHHAEHDSSFDAIAGTLQDLGVILTTITGTEIPTSNSSKSAVAQDLTSAVVDLNNQIGAATNGIIDLRMIVPIGLGALAIRQLLNKGWQIETVPWYVLAWYSFDSFIKLHYTTEPEAKTQQNLNNSYSDRN